MFGTIRKKPSYYKFYGISQYYRRVQDIDEWLRRRIRMCCWKQWRYPRIKVRKLMELGIPKDFAIMTGVSSQSYRNLSKNLAGKSRNVPKTPCTKLLTDYEWKVLYLKVNEKMELPKTLPTIGKTVIWIASLGGYLARKNNGPPSGDDCFVERLEATNRSYYRLGFG